MQRYRDYREPPLTWRIWLRISLIANGFAILCSVAAIISTNCAT